MSVPKKLDKFNNFVANSFKIKDSDVSMTDIIGNRFISHLVTQVKKQLWEHVQKAREV